MTKTDRGADSKLFGQVTHELLQQGLCVRFQARGASMSPVIRDGEVVQVTPVIVSKLRKDDIVLTKSKNGFRLHRIVVADHERDRFITRGDCGQQDDPPLCGREIVGIAVAKEVRVGQKIVRAKLSGITGRILCGMARGQRVAGRLFRRGTASANGAKRGASVYPTVLTLLFVLGTTAFLRAQVAVDATTSTSNTYTTTGNHTFTFAHTTTATANRVLLVGVSINITAVTGTTVTAMSYNGTAMTLVGAHNDTGRTRRVELWYLRAPTNGNHNVSVTVRTPTAGSIGVVVGATSFTGVDQTVPLGTFTSADGAAGANSQLDVPSVVNGMILDTVATAGSQTVTVSAPQTSQWNVASANNANPAVNGTGSSRSGAPSVPISETFSGTSNWSLGAVSINPTAADIGVTTGVNAVPLGQNSVYNITVSNAGPSAANNVVLTDTWAAAGLTLVSVTPSAGTSCVGTTPITCTLPASFASGATATVSVTVTASAAGFYPNTASVTDSGTPPDLNTGNNTYVTLAAVNNIVCAANTLIDGGTIGGTLNSYYPGTASVAAGATSIPVGAATGAGGAIANGSLLLVIQMQDASINTANSGNYGNGSTGSGFTNINNAGNYEFVKATGAVSAGSVPISGSGSGGGLVFGYTAAAASTTKGQSTYQVVLVPQYLSATFSSATPPTALGWNGSTGGILALDISGTLNLNGAAVSVDGLGFRGGAGLQLNGGVGGANTDYQFAAPATYTGALRTGVDAPKGEGVAGTPAWVESGASYLATGTSYPSGVAGSDGSMARGAPGNAGGGGTDGHSSGNDENAGGGGGGNGGTGGFGGDSWNSNLSSGGEGGSPFPATINRIALGGGGGAGSRNNSDGDNQASGAAAGGGLIFIRTGSLTGTATITANGASAYNATSNDAGGGGGAGGTIIVLSGNGGESGLTLQAKGGDGGNAWSAQAYALTQRHGPGGGGGGGIVFISGNAASAPDVSGGVNGLTLNTPAVPYGATSGTDGTTAITSTLLQVTGILSSALCAADMTLGKSHVGNFTRGGTASYTIPVSNVGAYGPTIGIVTMNDTLPPGLTPSSASGTGWSCSVTAQTVSCVRSDALAAGASYPSITLNANVLQSAAATLTNTASVGGGGEANLANDTATDVASVGSSADLGVTDSASPNPVAAGSNITYTQIVTNNGLSAADNATAVIAIPANTTLVSIAAPPEWSCIGPAAGGTGSIVCTNVDMMALTASTFTLVVKVNAGTANGTVITEAVSVGSSAFDPNSANNKAAATTIVGATAAGELTVTNVASPNPVLAGNNITYTQVVTNTGSAAATTATFNQATPTNTTFVSITPPAGWSCAGFPPLCTNPSVASGASGIFTVVYKVTVGTGSGTVITDTATVNAANQAFGANAAIATDVVATAIQADLALSTAATPATIFSGNNITYTQTITNNGPAAASGVSFSEPIPTNTTFSSVSAPVGWTCTVTGTVTCTNPSLAIGAVADIVVVVKVASTVAAGTITANSSVTATTGDPLPANNSTTVLTTIAPVCDLQVTNSGAPSPATAGANIVYTQIVTNSGPSNCSAGTFSEALPANTSFVSVAVVTTGGGTWTCPNASPIACTNPSVLPGSTGTITATYKVLAGTAAGTIITDTATVATTGHDTYLTNNSATVTIGVASGTQADLRVTNSATPNPVTAGTNITYTQSVTNGGPATANAPVFTEMLPAGTTAVSLTGSAGWTCVLGTLTCTDTTTMAANTMANFTFVVKVNTNVASGTSIAQTDSVSSTTADPNGGNNSATINELVAVSGDLSVTNTANPVPVLANNNITFTQIVNNAGPSTVTTVSLTETLPANTTAVSLTGPVGWTCTVATLLCTNSALAPSTPSTFTFIVKVNAGTPSGTAISETANVTSAVTDPNLPNSSATASDVVATAGQADLVVTNSAAPVSVAAGSNVTYSQSVTNKGLAATTAGMTFTQITPPNMNFQSITPPAGWVCGTVPPVGGSGTITCTNGGSLAVNGTANFTLVLQVNAVTPSGTSITETDTATAGNIVPGLTNNSASATVIVANANSADVAIVKTATPNPVLQGDPLTYTLAVTNNGPASATNVTVTDSLPSVVSYLSSNTTQGSCSEAGGTVTCLLGTMANGGTATITILTIPGTPNMVSNTATVAADQTDPVPANNSSTQTETIIAPTSVTLQSFSAHTGTDKNGASRVVLTWKTSGEAHNLGFNVYREEAGNRVRMNPSMIAGSALLMSGALPRHAGRSYAWIDPSAGVAGASYWLEDIDVNGTRTLHGPVSVQAGARLDSDASAAETHMFSQMNQALPSGSGSQESHIVETVPAQTPPSAAQVQKQLELAEHSAVKILVMHEGWHRVAQPDLVAAGLDPNVDPALLHLFAEAIEQPIQITGATSGPGGFGPKAAINFYGTGIDTEFSGTRVYWLGVGETPGHRIQRMQISSGSNQPANSYLATVELKQHTTYFAALLTSNGENFFGALVSPAPVDQLLFLPHLDRASSQPARLELALQGVITAFPHDVRVAVNGSEIGDVTFTGQAKGRLNVTLPQGLLQNGNNIVTLTAQNGDYDTSLVQFIDITYPHTYLADGDELKFTGRAGDQLKVGNFTSTPTVLDITDPDHPVELTPQSTSSGGEYEMAVQVPWTTTNPAAPVRHTLLAVADHRVASVAGLRTHRPTHWHSPQPGADIAMVTFNEFSRALAPLVKAHQAEGKSSAVILVTDLYDEFNFGERSPFAIRQFLQSATQNWKNPPTYLLLNGRASLDPRNYLGLGHLDLVPTRILPTSNLMTASDDWFSDFSNTGMPGIATGRLPVGTPDEANTVVGKIVAYEGKSTNGSWTSKALMVADRDDTESFSQATQKVQAHLPATMHVTDVFTGTVGTAAAQTQIVEAINSGQLLVNYLGHGSEEQWSGANIFDANSVTSLTNGSQLPVFLIMNCLNGFFQDVYSQPLGVTLLLAPNGGAVAVLTSSGLNQPIPQTTLDALIVQSALGAAQPTLGESILKAKSHIGDRDVRKTYVLLGDPAMQVKRSSAGSKTR
jgi:uncharacterized repeat protein (TIGR01451 family)